MASSIISPIYTFVKFLAVDLRSTYHGVLCLPTLKEFWLVASIHQMCIKFSIEHRITTIRGNQTYSKEYYLNSLRKIRLYLIWYKGYKDSIGLYRKGETGSVDREDKLNVISINYMICE